MNDLRPTWLAVLVLLADEEFAVFKNHRTGQVAVRFSEAVHGVGAEGVGVVVVDLA